MKPIVFALFLAFTPVLTLAQSGDERTIQEKMTPQEFKNSGLDKLNKTELKNLNDWINGVKTVVVEKIVAVPATAKAVEPTDDFQSTIVGDFNGFRGDTRITLANGQIWDQADSKVLHIKKIKDPKVSFSYSGFAGWKVQVDGYNAWIRVKRAN